MTFASIAAPFVYATPTIVDVSYAGGTRAGFGSVNSQGLPATAGAATPLMTVNGRQGIFAKGAICTGIYVDFDYGGLYVHVSTLTMPGGVDAGDSFLRGVLIGNVTNVFPLGASVLVTGFPEDEYLRRWAISDASLASVGIPANYDTPGVTVPMTFF